MSGDEVECSVEVGCDADYSKCVVVYIVAL